MGQPRSQRKIKHYMEINENENIMFQNLWDAAKNGSKREVYSNTGLCQEQEKSEINNLTLYLKELEKEL